jgi:pseudouridine synthase
MQERLQKILSARGIASRRKAEEYIMQGLVTVNGKVAVLGQKADPETDTIEVDGKVLESRQEMLYLLMHKPVGVLTSNVSREKGVQGSQRVRGGQRVRKPQISPERLYPTVRELLPKQLQGKIFPVGRLDKDSSGLLLMTNDGVVAFRLTHPKFDHEKEYEVTVHKAIAKEDLQKMADGMIILGSRTKPATLRFVADNRFTIALSEGKNRQIRRMCEKLGYQVKSLERIRIVHITDTHLKAGDIRELTKAERERLLSDLGAQQTGKDDRPMFKELSGDGQDQ